MDPTAIIDHGPRDVIDVRGDDAISYLQGQLSQDVEAMEPGRPAWSLLLEPTGKMGWWIRVIRSDEPGRLRIDVDAGAGEAVLARLERFKLRAAVAFEVQPGPTVDPAPLDVDLEVARIQAGVPRTGAEITDDVIPAELGQWLIDASVSFTKGCYTGQELVARIDSRGGNVPRKLRGLVLAEGPPPPVGAEVVVDDEVVGAVTSVAGSGDRQAAVALAFVRRKIEPPVAAVVRSGSDRWTAEIRPLPLLADGPA